TVLCGGGPAFGAAHGGHLRRARRGRNGDVDSARNERDDDAIDPVLVGAIGPDPHEHGPSVACAHLALQRSKVVQYAQRVLTEVLVGEVVCDVADGPAVVVTLYVEELGQRRCVALDAEPSIE